MRNIILLILLLVSSFGYAGAEFGLTGTDMLDLCKSDKDEDKAICAYYIAGFSGGVSRLTVESGQDAIYCLPVAIRLHQLTKLYLQYSLEKPELLDSPSDVFVYAMLKQYFPCQVASD